MHYMLEYKALSSYPVEPLYESSYETYQMFCFQSKVISNKTFDKSCTKIQLGSEIRLKIAKNIRKQQKTNG